MKKILIAGKGSYIGTSVENYLQKTAGDEYRIDTISQTGNDWENYDFSPYDTVFDVTGIAHADVGHVSAETKSLYYRVNCDLAVRTAERARKQGVAQFIYMSSVIVYGDSAPVGRTKHITEQTKVRPVNAYGDSKFQAEQKLLAMETDDFHVAVIRSPMIYGKNSKGNYPLMAKMVGWFPVFPELPNQRSTLYVENLAEFVRLLINSGRGGIFYPQNAEYITTSRMVECIGEVKGRKVHLSRLMNPFVYLASRFPGKMGGMVNKAFGSLTIDQSLSRKDFDGYQIFTLEESIRRTEGKCEEQV